MALADHLKSTGYKVDKVLEVYHGLDNADKAALKDALTSKGSSGHYEYTGADVARALKADGLAASDGQFINAGQVGHLRRKLEDGKETL